MDTDFTSKFQKYLNRSEKITWNGKPKSGIVIRKSDRFMIPFSLFFFGFSVLWVYFSSTVLSAPLFSLVGIPFIIIGFHLLILRFFLEALQRRNTSYALTNERVLILSGIFKKTLNSIPINVLTSISFEEKPDGSGTIQLSPKKPDLVPGGDFVLIERIQYFPSLEMIQHVREVYNKIVRTQNKAKQEMEEE